MSIFRFGYRVEKFHGKFPNLFTLSERYKGTFVEKILNYWKGVFADYKDVTLSLVKGLQEKPGKAAFYMVSGFGLYQCGKRNPNEEDFLKQFRLASNDLIMVHPSLQNPNSASFIKRLQRDINHNRLRFLSLGIFTVIWEDLYDKEDCTYPAQCEYTQVNQWNFYKHIVDVGFLHQFWRLKYELYNYDVNYL